VTTPLIVFDDLDSTSAEARRRALAGERGPLWLMARRQSAGRGRRGRVWRTGGGDLAATLLITLEASPARAAQLAFVAALGVADLVQDYAPKAALRLKWPNDVFLDGRKLAGVLIESGPAPAGELWFSVGIGVNLASAPTDVDQPAIALADVLAGEAARPPSPDEAMERLSVTVRERLDQWLGQGFDPIRQAWLERAMGMGQACTARLAGQTLTGVAEGLDVDGALLLRLPDRGLARITAGDVFFGER
jgi:BirA family biotin operon repressor/biotin-[acetyl-CoA-carboxylase] ligase